MDKLSVLIVEDNPVHAKLIRKQLEEATTAFECIEVNRLDAAIERNGGQRRARAYVRSQLRRLDGGEPSGKRLRGL